MKAGMSVPAGAMNDRKAYQRPSVAARLYHLEVGEQAVFLVSVTVQQTLNAIHNALAKVEALQGRQYKCEKWLLVREGEMPRPVVLVTRSGETVGEFIAGIAREAGPLDEDTLLRILEEAQKEAI